jgi:hypothetical protein
MIRPIKQSIIRQLSLVLISWALFLPLAAAESPGDEGSAPPIDVLMISGNEDNGQIGPASLGQPGWQKFKAACAAQGVRVHLLGEGNSTYDQLTSDLLRKFQVIVCAGAPHNYNIAQSKVAEGAAFVQRLDAYHKAGGGIIFIPFGHDSDPKFWTESFGKEYDAQALEEEIYDPSKVLHVNPLYKSVRCDYFWTDAIRPHPVTEGMHGLLLPRHGDYDFTGTVPMQFGKSWTVLIRGMDTARTIGLGALVGGSEGAYNPEIKGTYGASPEVVGVRESDHGAGRMMVFPFHPAHTWSNFHSWVLNDAMMLNGYEGNPSDGFKLFLNGVRWLAKPAQTAGLGGYVPPPEKTVADVTPIDWSKAEFPANSWSGAGSYFNARTQEDDPLGGLVTPQSRDFKGILGARTAYSDGSGTVAEYVAEAKKLGLSFVVFLEDLPKIDPARYAKLVADCKASSSADFQALPGYLFRDTIGVQYYAINAPELPRESLFTADRRVKAPSDIFLPGNNYASGGIAELGKTKMDPYFLLSYFTIAPYVYDNGKLVDDGFSMYRSLQGRLHGQGLVSLTIVRSPADLAKTVSDARLVVYHAQDMSLLTSRLGPSKLWNPNPVYITSGPSITRWGTLNPIGLPFAPGRQRVRFALEAHSDAGISDVTILEARSGTVFRHFKPGDAKDFACTIDETHKDQWYLIPVITDRNGRTAVGPTIETFQDGNRVSAYMDNIDSGAQVIGWDENHKMLKQWSGWIASPFHKGSYPTGDMPANPFADELIYHGVDGSSIGCGHCEIDPQVVMGDVTEPKIGAFYFENWLASFDDVVGKYGENGQFLDDPLKKLPGCNWTSAATIPQPMQFVDINTRTEAVRARYHAPISANINEVDVAFKKDCSLTRINLVHTFNRVQTGPMYVAGKDQQGEWSGVDDGAKDSFNHSGVLGAGDYLFMGSDYAGAPAVINVGETPLSYSYAGQGLQVFVDGNGRAMKAGDKITARFMIINKPREGQNNTFWLKKFIADYAIGGGKPGYDYSLSQGKLHDINYTMNLDPENGGAAVAVKKYDLPHNLLVKVSGLPAHAVAGRYDPDRKQLLILPVYENTATTSINTTLGDTRLYVGELFHCDDDSVLLSCVQDGADKLLLEVHNPGDSAKTVTLDAVPSFTPLAGLNKTLTIPPCSSVKLSLPAPAGTLIDVAYQGD